MHGTALNVSIFIATVVAVIGVSLGVMQLGAFDSDGNGGAAVERQTSTPAALGASESPAPSASPSR